MTVKFTLCWVFGLLINANALGQSVTFKFDKSEVGRMKQFNVPLTTGKFFYPNLTKAKVDKNGTITLRLNLTKPGIINFERPKLVQIYVEPQSNMEVHVSGDSLLFSGDLAAENTGLNSLSWYGYTFATDPSLNPQAMKKLNRVSDPDKFLLKVDSMIASDQETIRSTRSQHPLSKTFLEFAIPNIRLYYYDVAFGSIQRRFLTYSYTTHVADSSVISSNWGKTLAIIANKIEYEWSTENQQISQWYFSNIYNYIVRYHVSFLKENLSRSPTEADRQTTFNRNLFVTAVPSAVDAFLPSHLREFFIPNYLAYYTTGDINFYSESMLSYYNQFVKSYPTSIYRLPLKTRMAPITAHVNSMNKAQPSASTVVVSNFDKIDNFSTLMSQFRGKVVFIDVWATWCGPCIEEFQFLDELRRLQNHRDDFAILYLSRDKTETRKKWEKYIYAKQIEGFHMIPNATLASELAQMFNWHEIPRYLIVDRKGNIINKDAPAPSTGVLLLNQLNALLAASPYDKK